jgi:RHS repeat-associated protein
VGNNSRSAASIISVPKGGGALQGIGEKFSPDLHTGTGNFTVPIALPPGRNGFQPQVNLVYSTGHGNGPFGLGWSLSIPGVSRRTSKGVPRYDDSRDVFVLSGAEDLVPVPGAPDGATRYRPRTEGLFAEIEHHHARPNDHWKVRSKDGLTSWYGTPRPEGAPEGWADPAVVRDPAAPRRVFAWRLTRTGDPFGNQIVYEYERDSRQVGPHHWDQLYLKRIRYVDYPQNDETRFLVSVTFEYDERPDPFSEYRAGFEIRTTWRCTRIEIRTHADQERLVRSYRLTYLDERPGLEHLRPLNGLSLLSQIDVVGHDGDRTEALPPLEFGYTRFEPDRRDFFPVTGSDLPALSLAHPDLELADLFGNGLPDILEMNGTVRYWRNLGAGRFDFPREMRTAPAGLRLADAGVQLIDANGDGRTDLLVTTEALSGYYPLRFGGLWDRRSFQRYRLAPSFDLKDPEVRLVDLDGDGVTDAIRSGTRLECFFNDPREGWNGTRRVDPQSLAGFPLDFSDPRVKWADMTGDGLQDIVLVHGGDVEYWPNLGHGNWGPRVHMEGSPSFPYGYDPKRILVADVDGDGVADLVYVDDRKVTLWINRGGDAWSDPLEIDGTPPVSDMDGVRLADLLGSGVSGILWSADAGDPARARMFFLDFTGGVKPYLLAEMDNHLGAVTRVAYAPSTRFYLEDERRPETRWKTTLPFPVQVVARVESIDAISGGKLTTEYRYRHGYWDGVEREFPGFGRVDQRDTEVFGDFHAPGLHPDQPFAPVPPRSFSPPIETRTWFHQGPVGDEVGDWEEPDYRTEFWWDDPPVLERPPEVTRFLQRLARRVKRDALRALRGRILRTELYALDAMEHRDRPYTVTEHLHGVASLPVGEPLPEDPEPWRLEVFFPHVVAERTTQWERGDDPMTQLTFTDAYDAFGQPRQSTVVALPRRSATRQPVEGAVIGRVDPDEPRILATHTRTGYATPDPGVFIGDRVAHVHTFELDPPPEVTESQPDTLRLVLAEHATAAAQVHGSFRERVGAWQPGAALPAGVRLLGHTVNHYDGPAFVGRPPGELGPYGALTRSESLVFTDEVLQDAYGDRRPAYLDGNAGLPNGTPAGFPGDLGYRLESAVGTGYHDGYYADTLRRRCDFQEPAPRHRRGLVTGTEDALRNRFTIEPDSPYWVVPVSVRDPAGLETIAEYDDRVMQPSQVTDPNGNTTRYTHTPLGFLRTVVLEGQHGEGGTSERPEIEYTYDFLAYDRTRNDERSQPVSVHTLQRVWHANDAQAPANARDDTIESREYSDGFGRLIQKRAQAEELVFGERGDDIGLSPEPGSDPSSAVGHRAPDRVVVSGWQVYDNKGRVVERYEPVFATGWAYQGEGETRQGQPTTLHYDPRGHLVRRVNPDGSEERTVFGIPVGLADTTRFRPSPWEIFTYDANDLAPLSYHPVEVLPGGLHRPLSDRAPQAHHFTPAGSVLDGLGRVICQVERNGVDLYVTRFRHDLRGDLIEVRDPLQRLPFRHPAFQHRYDLLDRRLRTDSIDAGLRTSVLDAAGNVVETRDSRGSVVLRRYDGLNRLTELWAREGGNGAVTLREQLVYGDTLPDRDAARRDNLLGRLVRHADEAGVLEFTRYDFKANLMEKRRRVVSDAALRDAWTANWSAPDSEDVLDSTDYATSFRYDALNRAIAITCPRDLNGGQAQLRPSYNMAGALESVTLDDTPYVTHIAYNARGQRVLIAYGNGVMTRYVYDPYSFRLARLRTERLRDQQPADTWTGTGSPIQDFTYDYDLVGNITTIEERTPGSGIANTVEGRDRLVRRFEYDPLYRLKSANGRACGDIGAPRPLTDARRCGAYDTPYVGGGPHLTQDNAPDLSELYTETYEYDSVGNLLNLAHQTGNWARTFGLGGLLPEQWREAPNNRLTSLTQGGVTHSFEYDENGNLIRQNTERHHGWDHADRMTTFRIQPAGGAPPSMEARHLYGADGLRVKKWVRHNGSGDGESTVYIDELFEHHVDHGTDLANNAVHVMDSSHRIALVRRGPAHPDDAGPTIQYHLGDHLGSSHIVTDDEANWRNREEFFPYGETSFGSFARKRYRFTSKERDEESELSYHRARYYAPVLARWVNCDPTATVVAGLSASIDRSPAKPPAWDHSTLYAYVRNNPMKYVDPSGYQESGTSDPGEYRGSRAPEWFDRGRVALERWYARERERILLAREVLPALLVEGLSRASRSRWLFGPEEPEVYLYSSEVIPYLSEGADADVPYRARVEVLESGSRSTLPGALLPVARELFRSLERSSSRGFKTVALGLVKRGRERFLVYAASGNWTSPALEAEARRLGIVRLRALARAPGRGASGAASDAEQLLIEAAGENNLRILAVVPSRSACLDCLRALQAEGIALVRYHSIRRSVAELSRAAR